jgi:hypothetical protein
MRFAHQSNAFSPFVPEKLSSHTEHDGQNIRPPMNTSIA